MDKRNKPNWDWFQVECQLKTMESSKKNAIWQLTPSIVLTNPTVNFCDPAVRLYIDTQKSLQYTPDLGWNWHKSWNLPNISIRLEIKDEISNEQLLSPKNLYAQIFAVKKSPDASQRSDKTTLIDVGIRGQSRLEMVDGQAYFSAMKFSSTTYNNEGVNFNLLIVLYITESDGQRPKVLTAVISPPIFVDSRRSARDYQQKKFNSFIEPFTLDQIDKEFIKRENKSKNDSQVLIKNDSEGLYNYLTAPNIRHKVKHPVFLAIKFSNCVKILYNSKLITAQNINELLETLQKKLLKDNSKSKIVKNNESEESQNNNDKCFIFLTEGVNDSLKKKKVMESIDAMANSQITLSYDRKEVPATFEDIAMKGNLTRAYRDVYSNLMAICKNFEPSDQGQSEDYESEEDSYGSQNRVKMDQKSSQNPNRVRVTRRYTNSKGSNNNGNNNEQILPLPKREEEDPVYYENGLIPQENHKNFSSVNLNLNKKSAFNNIHHAENIKFKLSDQPNGNCESFKRNQNPNIYTQGYVPYQQKNGSDNEHSPGLANQISHSHNSINSHHSQGNPSQGNQGKALENMLSDNVILNNWLNGMKANNMNLYENMRNNQNSTSNHIPETTIQPNSQLRQTNQTQGNQQHYLNMALNAFGNGSEVKGQGNQNLGNMGNNGNLSDSQSILALLQQINLYKNILAQVSYQNNLLGRSINTQGNNSTTSTIRQSTNEKEKEKEREKEKEKEKEKQSRQKERLKERQKPRKELQQSKQKQLRKSPIRPQSVSLNKNPSNNEVLSANHQQKNSSEHLNSNPNPPSMNISQNLLRNQLSQYQNQLQIQSQLNSLLGGQVGSQTNQINSMMNQTQTANLGMNMGMGNLPAMGMGNFNINHQNNSNQVLASLLSQIAGSNMNQNQQSMNYGNYGNSPYGNQSQSTNQQQGFTGLNNNLNTLTLLSSLGQNGGLGNMMNPMGLNAMGISQQQNSYQNSQQAQQNQLLQQLQMLQQLQSIQSIQNMQQGGSNNFGVNNGLQSLQNLQNLQSLYGQFSLPKNDNPVAKKEQ